MPEYTLVEWALILAAALGDGFLLRTFGSGVGITLLPLLTLAFPPRFALALIALYSTMASWGMVRDLWAEWDRRTVYVLMPGLVAGTFFGAWVLTWLTDLRLRQIIGLVCLLFALDRLIAEFRRRPARAGRFPLWAGAGLGVFSGFSSTLANTGATILVPFLIAQQFTKAATLGTLWFLFFIVNPIKLFAYWQADVLQVGAIWTALAGIPLLWAGLRLGAWVHRRLPPRAFNLSILSIALAGSIRLLMAG